MIDGTKGGIDALMTLGKEGQHSCLSSARLLSHLGDKWTIPIMGALAAGPVRFNILLRTINGLTHRMLTLTLRKLQRDGLVLRMTHDTSPVSVDYALTSLGEALIEHLRPLVHWAHDNKRPIAIARQIYDRQVGNLD